MPRTRPEVAGDATAASIVARIREVEWGQLNHAYGPADDVGPELEALTLGDASTRRAAWEALWGSVHHQGTVYEATLPAVAVLADLAGWNAFPDRREALCMLGAFAEGDGSRASEVADAVRVRARDLLANWREAPPLVQRALLMLSRSTGVENSALHASILPKRLEESWSLGTSREIWARFGDEQAVDGSEAERFDAAMDALTDLENWAFAED